MMTSEELYYATGVDLSDDELMHFGVRGMKWGRRKGRASSQRSHRKKRQPAIDMNDPRSVRRNWRRMTAEQKQEAVRHLNVEDQYNAHLNKRAQLAQTYMKLGGTALGTIASGLALYKGYDQASQVFNERRKRKKGES